MCHNIIILVHLTRHSQLEDWTQAVLGDLTHRYVSMPSQEFGWQIFVLPRASSCCALTETMWAVIYEKWNANIDWFQSQMCRTDIQEPILKSQRHSLAASSYLRTQKGTVPNVFNLFWQSRCKLLEVKLLEAWNLQEDLCSSMKIRAEILQSESGDLKHNGAHPSQLDRPQQLQLPERAEIKTQVLAHLDGLRRLVYSRFTRVSVCHGGLESSSSLSRQIGSFFFTLMFCRRSLMQLSFWAKGIWCVIK